jgi:UDP-N-acetylmuramoyl-tripeptide--D-alanyl-D-alanine ligase
VLATRGNLNNDIGMPLTLLELRDTHRAAVIEMGMNHPGEIAYLAALAQPTVALVNNAQRAHLRVHGFVRGRAREGRDLPALPSAGVAVIPADDPHAAATGARSTPARRL